MNARELAATLGVSETTVSRLLSGERHPSLTLMTKIRDLFGGAWSIDEQARELQLGRYGESLRAWMKASRLRGSGIRR